MTEAFITWRPSSDTQALLGVIDTVLSEYEAMGYQLTLRQLYYQLVSRDVIPNTVRQYKALGGIVSQGRLAGLIDWKMIEDRVRVPVANTHWNVPSAIMKAAAEGFYIDRWRNQRHYVEVCCEKDAVSNIIEPVCRQWDVLFLANRGYSSQTAMYDASKRLLRADREQKLCIVLYFGDHDPSGLDMTRDVQDRLAIFGARVEVHRVALSMAQVEKYDPPENPAKQTDSRFAAYAAEHGDSSWELDALAPDVLAKLVEKAITKYVDKTEFGRVVADEHKEKQRLQTLAAIFETSGDQLNALIDRAMTDQADGEETDDGE